MLDLLQKNFAPFSLRSVRTARPGVQNEWMATICVNGTAVGKLQTFPDVGSGAEIQNAGGEETSDVTQYALDLCFNHDCHRTHFEQHAAELMRTGVLENQDIEAAMVDLLTLMADAYLGDKAIYRLAKEGSTIYRLRSDPINAYRRLHRPFTTYLGQELRLLHEDLEWVLNEMMDRTDLPARPALRLVTTSGAAATRH